LSCPCSSKVTSSTLQHLLPRTGSTTITAAAMRTSATSTATAAAATAATLLVVVLATQMTSMADAAPNCDDSYMPNTIPSRCKFGIAQDWCRRQVCAKGPGEQCGGRWLQHGTCGAGLYCACNRCTGCSPVTLDCFYGQFC
ncbi:unnamed protein product, partial [Meganyctiphanes norvegica]